MMRKLTGKLCIVAVCSFAFGTANAEMDHDPMVLIPMPPPMSEVMMPMDYIVYEDVGFIENIGYSSNQFYIPMDTTGNDKFYRATLTDFEFPSAFNHLALNVTTSTDSLGSAHLMGGGQDYFDFEATPGLYYANLFGHAGGDMMTGNVSLYGVQVAMVPEMEVWAMMLAGMGLIGYQLRRRQSEDALPA